MKPILVRTILFLLPLSFVETGYSQNATSALAINRPGILAAAAKIAAAEADFKVLLNLRTLSEKTYKRFTKEFSGSYNIHVFPTTNKIQVNHQIDGIQHRTLYTSKGRFLHNIRYYDNEMLPEKVVEAVAFAYPRYWAFGGVIEVAVNDKIAYFVLIEDKTSWKRVRVVDGEVFIHEEFTKLPDQVVNQ
jgi:hypothetical protein